jgi:hypothetical protein
VVRRKPTEVSEECTSPSSRSKSEPNKKSRRSALCHLLVAGFLCSSLIEPDDEDSAFEICGLHRSTRRYDSEDTTLRNHGCNNLKSKIIIKDILNVCLLISLSKQYLENEFVPHGKHTVSPLKR